MKEQSKLLNGTIIRRLLFFTLLLFVIAYSHTSIITGQFTGEDEPSQWVAAAKLIKTAHNENFSEFIRTLAFLDQPPLRYLLSIPGLLIWPHTEFGLRFIAIIFSFFMTYQVYRLGREIGAERTGVWSSLLVAASGVYNWTSMAFGWSVAVTCMLFVIRILLAGPLDLNVPGGNKRFALINFLIMVMFLINTGNILFFITISMMVMWENRRRIRSVILPIGLTGSFYLLYYLYFFGWVTIYVSPTGQPIGQLAHNLQRSDAAFAYLPIFANLMGLNAYFFPYIACLLVGLALVAIIRQHGSILAWFSLYVFAWSFVLSGQTAQYFLLFFIAVLPFGVASLVKSIPKRVFNIGGLVLFFLVLGWNQILFIQRYGSNDPAYPTQFLNWGMAEITRQHNIYEPYSAIASDLNYMVKKGSKFCSGLSGSFTTFYYKNIPVEPGEAGYAGMLGSPECPVVFDKARHCYQPAWKAESGFVFVTGQTFCAESVELISTYPLSRIRLYFFKPKG